MILCAKICVHVSVRVRGGDERGKSRSHREKPVVNEPQVLNAFIGV